MDVLLDKITTLWPEITLLLGAISCLVTGLHPNRAARNLTPWVAALSMGVASLLVAVVPEPGTHPLGFDGLSAYVELAVLGVGLLLLAVAAGLPDALKQHRRSEAAADRGKFEPADALKGEFYAFFLLSITGCLMTAGASDLVWLFLALELVSLPTYVMIATTRDSAMAQESAIKYFFLGAMSAALFLYGFAFIYGATGFTDFEGIRAAVSMHGVSPLMTVGLVLATLGLCFKVAAVPMHVYAADVYEGAATPVTAFLAFVPKVAGFVALMLVLGLVGWPLPKAVVTLLAVIAVLTMTLGNLLAVVQTSLKRMLAYSSIAQSGYLMLGLIAGPALAASAASGLAIGNGLAAILFYLPAYGLATVAAFAVIAALRTNKQTDAEAETYDDLAGLAKRQPVLCGVLLLAALSLVGLPPLAGFAGKVMLGGAVAQSGIQPLSALLLFALVLNSAISAAYYLRLGLTPFIGKDTEATHPRGVPFRFVAASVAALGVVALGLVLGSPVATAAHRVTQHAGSPSKNAAVAAVEAETPVLVELDRRSSEAR
ncbi:MAG: NADH-quinone oxidoreductase subunit N [Planctomycetota bacterium]